ncbi:hypothetical protein RDI58_020006 [Solanum bulbocastanum]|uniref:Uncharacterized protein n=1 Tax=Solanum bulbocastanum TaxID=147425 RepID=A0AAN8T5T6_SOLBU
MGLVENIWKKEYRTGQMQRVWCKLKALQPVLRQLNNEFKFISQKMEKAREELNRIQEHITSQATDEQINQVEKWSMIDERALRQKSRIKWIQLGDANNKSFSSIIKKRTRKKQIRSITSLSGQMIYDPTEIQDEFVQFYKSLMGTTTSNMSAIDVQIMRRENKQSRIKESVYVLRL